MARPPLLDQMRNNPAGDWRIEDVKKLCNDYSRFGVRCAPPSGGSHYKVSCSRLREILTIPARRPIKPVYIRKLVAFIDSASAES